MARAGLLKEFVLLAVAVAKAESDHHSHSREDRLDLAAAAGPPHH